jgi:hypothetical protein
MGAPPYVNSADRLKITAIYGLKIDSSVDLSAEMTWNMWTAMGDSCA